MISIFFKNTWQLWAGLIAGLLLMWAFVFACNKTSGAQVTLKHAIDSLNKIISVDTLIHVHKEDSLKQISLASAKKFDSLKKENEFNKIAYRQSRVTIFSLSNELALARLRHDTTGYYAAADSLTQMENNSSMIAMANQQVTDSAFSVCDRMMQIRDSIDKQKDSINIIQRLGLSEASRKYDQLYADDSKKTTKLKIASAANKVQLGLLIIAAVKIFIFK